MSQENEVVRQPIAVRGSSGRSLEERLALRFPRTAATIARAALRLRPRSRLRRALTRRFIRLIFEAANRGDYEAAFALYPPGCETITPPELVGLGFEPSYRGPEGRMRFQMKWMEELGDFKQELEEVVDAGDRLLMLGRMKGIGLGSGAVFDSEVAYLLTISAGRVVREQPFRSRAEAIEAARLSD